MTYFRYFVPPLIGLIAVAFFLVGNNFLFAQLWTNPAADPISTNVHAPITATTTSQTKSGDFLVNNLFSSNLKSGQVYNLLNGQYVRATAQMRSNAYCNLDGTVCGLPDALYRSAINCHWSGYIGQWGGGTELYCPAGGVIKGYGIEDNSLDVAAVRIYCCSVGPSTPVVTGNWQTGSWGAWSFRYSGRCGDPRPTRTRSVTCRSSLDGSLLPESTCGLSSKPSSSEMNMTACSGGR